MSSIDQTQQRPVTWSPTHTDSSPRSLAYPVALDDSRQPKQHARLLVSNHQGPGGALTGQRCPTVEFVQAGRLDLAMDVVGTARSSPHCPPSMALIARAGPGACRAES
jgi:hypothetical protein